MTTVILHCTATLYANLANQAPKGADNIERMKQFVESFNTGEQIELHNFVYSIIK